MRDVALVRADRRPPGRASGVRKELHYFDRFWEQPVGPEEIEGYACLFPRPPGTITGEWTPRYMRDFWAPPLIAQAAPEAKILVLLRDPVERFISAMALLVRQDGALAGDTRNGFDQAWRGRYAEQLTWLYRHVPREQVLVQQYERCVADPAGELAGLYRFLGLDSSFSPASLDQRINAEGRPWTLSAHMERELHRFYAEDLRRLPDLAPGIDLGLWPSSRRSPSGRRRPR